MLPLVLISGECPDSVMNPFRIVGGGVSQFRIPLRVPFITAAGRKDSTINVGVRICLAGGAEGYGEASGSIVYRHLAPGRLAAALSAELRRVHGRDARAWAALSREAWSRCAAMPPAAAAFECALADALSLRLGVGLAEWFGGAVRRLETDITLSAASPRETQEAARLAAQEGFRIFKIKVGTGHRRDAARVMAAWRMIQGCARSPRIILDGNQRLTTRSALRLTEYCLRKSVPVVLLEQPLPRGRLQEAAALRRRCPVPLAADEDVRSPEEALRVIDAGAADVLNVKLAKTGIAGSLGILSIARAAGRRLMIGCMQESARGLKASVELAMGTGAFDFVDLDSDRLLSERQPGGNFRRDGPWISLPPQWA